MNKIFFKALILFIGLVVIIDVSALSLEPYVNENTNYKVIIEDDANLLTEEELNKLKKEIIPITEYGNVVFKTVSTNFYSAAGFAEKFYYDNFSTSSGTLLLIDMENRMIYIFSDGENYKHITISKSNIITDNIYSYATDGKYYECASKGFEQIYTILQGGKIAEPMRYISNAFISITLACFISFIIVLISAVVKTASVKEIVNGCCVSFNISDVQVVKTGQTSVYSPQSSDSGDSSSGGSGGGGGGGSSGGGGGHSF